MARKRTTYLITVTSLILAMLVLFGAGVGEETIAALQAYAQGPDQQSGATVQGESLGAGFTYQGRLTNESTGNPIAGPCDFQFSLWDAGNAGSQIGGFQTKSTVTLSDGNFSTLLDFGSNVFQGEARYLQIAVRCPAGAGGYTTLSGRVALSGAPYAHSLRPGATVSSSATSGAAVRAVALATSGEPAGLYGEANASNGAGVAGWNLASSGGYGVYGQATAGSGIPYGVYGYASHTGSATSYGVYGRSDSSAGTGVGGVAPMSGVYGRATGAAGYGIYGEATHASGTNYGVSGRTASPNGYGVYATNTAPVGAAGEPSALYATLGSTNGLAIYAYNSAGRGIMGQGVGRYGVGGFSDTKEGVYGFGDTGVYGRGDSIGTYGVAVANSGVTYGVFAEADASASGIGVYGRGGAIGDGVFGAGSTGVRGEGSVIGVVGESTASSGYAVGVLGESVSSQGMGGRFTNVYQGVDPNAVGVWAGSYGGDIIQGHELNNHGGSANLRFRVTYDGNVHADGTYTSPAADFAEMLPAVGDLEPGDVLVIGPDGRLMRSSAANQPTVVGVYSTQPGFLGGMRDGEDMEGQVPLAVVGVVPVKVSAENGPIQPGDMLVASSLPGHAMRAGANPSVGTVIGKALAGLDCDTGVIKMLVVLQ